SLHLSMRWLQDILYKSSKAGGVLVVLDCCYAGNIINTEPDPYEIDLYKLFKDFFEDVSAEKKKDRLRLILTATGHDAMAREKDGHGIMTNLLLQVLQGEV